MTLRLLKDRLLVKLAPTVEQTPTEAGILLEPAITPAVCRGIVVQTGPAVREIAVGQCVFFAPSVGDPVDGLFPTPHLILREPEVVGVLPKRSEVA